MLACRLADGGDVGGRRGAVIEDVVSSGGAVFQACTELRQLGADLAAVLCVIEHESGGSATLAAQGLHLQSLFTMSDLRQAADV